MSYLISTKAVRNSPNRKQVEVVMSIVRQTMLVRKKLLVYLGPDAMVDRSPLVGKETIVVTRFHKHI
jgi:hypothetical protein